MGELIAVLSGKGGTGKTSVCAGIASALAQMGQQVLCIDCDAGLPDLDIALGISELAALSFLEISEGGYDLAQATQHPLYPNLRFLTAPMNSSMDGIDQAAFSAMLDQAKAQYSYVFLDASTGLGPVFSLSARVADRILLVAGADPASIRDAAHTFEALELMNKTNVRLILNRMDKKLLSAMKLTVDDIMDRTGLPLLGLIPEDNSVLLAAAAKQPLLKYTAKGAAAACQRIAKRITGICVPVSL